MHVNSRALKETTLVPELSNTLDVVALSMELPYHKSVKIVISNIFRQETQLACCNLPPTTTTKTTQTYNTKSPQPRHELSSVIVQACYK
mmetsp:Transcript_36913/g.60027  ORF Transcript_36913/g.60027 Transcript_36913/m.60027 type:complete len:89 (+) Transcript_36913:3200-3466(+)